MHPGGDCIGCHRSEDEGPRYALAGTVMSSIDDETDCVGVGGVQVDVLDNTGAVALSITSNESGNFFSSSALAADALPYTIRLTRDGRTSTMATPQTELNCVLCHGATGASGSPGRIIAP